MSPLRCEEPGREPGEGGGDTRSGLELGRVPDGALVAYRHDEPAAPEAEIEEQFSLARNAWRDAGRDSEPRLGTAFWYALGSGARERVRAHLRRYLNWLDPAEVRAALPATGFAGSPRELSGLLRRIEDLGASEVMLVPTSADPEEVDRAAECLG